jgi:hypothetical protein
MMMMMMVMMMMMMMITTTTTMMINNNLYKSKNILHTVVKFLNTPTPTEFYLPSASPLRSEHPFSHSPMAILLATMEVAWIPAPTLASPPLVNN